MTAAEPVESITTMEAAADSRWLDAVAIAVERPREALGCAYLLGYVAECRLKAALGRVKGVMPAANLYAAAIQPLAPADRHDVQALLRECLAGRGAALPVLSVIQVSNWHLRVASVANAHAVSFRYKSYAPTLLALESLHTDVEWIVNHIEELWT